MRLRGLLLLLLCGFGALLALYMSKGWVTPKTSLAGCLIGLLELFTGKSISQVLGKSDILAVLDQPILGIPLVFYFSIIAIAFDALIAYVF